VRRVLDRPRRGEGSHIVLPEQCTLLADPKLLYGYESHDVVTGARVPAYAEKVWKSGENIEPVIAGKPLKKRAVPPPEMEEEMRLEEKEYPRPDWSLGPLPQQVSGRTDGGAEADG